MFNCAGGMINSVDSDQTAFNQDVHSLLLIISMSVQISMSWDYYSI